MSVLARELESYQRALNQYRRQAARYNRRADAHNAAAQAFTDALVRDEQGRPYVVWMGKEATQVPADHPMADRIQPQSLGEGDPVGVYVAAEDGTLSKSYLPEHLDPRDYELAPAGNGLMMLMRPSDEKRVETITGLVPTTGGVDDHGHPQPTQFYRQEVDPRGDVARIPFRESGYGPEWQMTPEQPWVDGNPFSMEYMRQLVAHSGPRTYTATREVSVLPESPGVWDEEFTLPEPQAPSATLSQVRRIGRPSLARMEGGLISEAIRGRGVR